jgi:hypothetical protein
VKKCAILTHGSFLGNMIAFGNKGNVIICEIDAVLSVKHLSGIGFR